MDRTTAPYHNGRMFQDADPASGVTQGTALVADDMNAHQEEIVRAIEAAGLAPDASDLGQLAKAMAKSAAPSSSDFSANGYAVFPGGLIVQWGQGLTDIAANGSAVVSWPIAFPHALVQAFATDVTINGVTQGVHILSWFPSGSSTTQGEFYGLAPDGSPAETYFTYLAIGR